VVAYREGAVLGEAARVTTGAPRSIRLTADRNRLTADGMDLAYILIEAYDGAGNAHPLSDARVRIAVDGPAEIAGVGNGDPQRFEPFQAEYVDLFYGKAMVILRSGHEAGRVRVRARADGLEPAVVELTVVRGDPAP